MPIEELLARPVSGIERPGVATQALLTGDIDVAWRAMLTPQALTPHERTEMGKKLGIDGGPFAQVFQGLTNPLLIVSLLLSHKFPVPAGDAVFKLSQKVGGLTARFPVLGRLASMQSLFRGTKAPDTISEIAFNVHDFRSRFGGSFGEALRKYQQTGGRLPNLKEQILVSAWLDGLHKHTRGFAGKNGVVRVGSGETTMSLPGVSALFPNLESKMGAPLLTLAKDMRGVLNKMWGEVFENLDNRKAILKAIRRQRSAGFSDDVTDVMESFLTNPKRIADYFPRRVLQSEEDFRRLIQLMTASGSSKRFAKAAANKATAWASPEVMKRQYAMVPAAEELALVQDFVDPKEVTKLQEIVKARVLHAARISGVRGGTIQKLNSIPLDDLSQNYVKYLPKGEAELMAAAFADHGPRQYSLKLMPVLSSYTHTLAGTYGWTVKGGGEKMMTVLEEARSAAGAGNPYAKARVEMLENTYIPVAMGRGTFRQALRAQMWDHSMLELGAWVGRPSVRKLLGDGLTDTIQGHLRSSKGAFSFMQLQRKASAYFYLSTLGMNPGSALKNMLQLVLTLGPVIGFRTASLGLQEAMRKSHKYFALRFGPRKMGHDAALRLTYPDFAKAGLVAAPITDEVVENTLQNAYNIAALPTAATKTADKVSRGMMSLFTASETALRLSSFEAGMLHARRAKMGIDESIQFSRKLVEQTQFLTGPQNTPHFMLGLPPLYRQFLQFPLRMLEFATSTAFTLGSGAIDPKTGKPMNVLGFNPGTFARMMAGSIIAMELGDVMGVDIRGSLVTSAVPTFQPPGELFAPLPIVPPFFQVAGALGVGVTTGDWKEALHSTPLLIPGGIQAFKIAGLLPPGMPGSEVGQTLSKAFERTYADYKQPAPDGRIAVFSGQGTFRGYYAPWDLIKQGLGIRGGDLDKEQQLLALVTKNRDAIAQSKRDYLDARHRNAAREANAVATQFKQQFGFSLPVTEADMQAMQTRRHITRLEQLIRTTPPGEARERLVQVVQATLGASAEAMMGVDPSLLGQPRPVAEKSRFGTGKVAGSSLPRFHAQTDLSPMDIVNPRTIGRQPGVNQLQPLP
jgi:hypothetical protein